jgi:hypothetical protein
MRMLLASATVIASLAAGAPTAGSTSPCSQQATRGVVQAFFNALRARDVDAADRVFATAGTFRWYSTTAPGRRSGRAAYARSTLRRYFAARIARKESLRIRMFDFNGTDSSRQISNFAGVLTRAATDLRPTRYRYKGATTCAASEPQIMVWSMAAARS